MKSPEAENNAQRKVKRKILGNEWELSGNYYRELSPSITLHEHYKEKLRFIGILAYPKIYIWLRFGFANEINDI